MGLTIIRGTVQRPDGRGRRRRLTFLIDSGAIYIVLPARVWKALDLAPTRHVQFALADGTTIERGIAEARFTISGLTATSPVVCGEERDSALVGAVTLETLGLMLNPLSRELLPMRLLLGRASPWRGICAGGSNGPRRSGIKVAFAGRSDGASPHEICP